MYTQIPHIPKFAPNISKISLGCWDSPCPHCCHVASTSTSGPSKICSMSTVRSTPDWQFTALQQREGGKRLVIRDYYIYIECVLLIITHHEESWLLVSYHSHYIHSFIFCLFVHTYIHICISYLKVMSRILSWQCQMHGEIALAQC